MRTGRAFSLLELLVVIAIISLLSSFAIFSFNSIGQARGVTEAAYQFASAVELARSEAISRKTYVWLGIQQETNAGNLNLRVGMVYSKDGSASTNTSNLQPIGRSLLLQRVGITDALRLDVGAVLTGVTELSMFSQGMGFTIGQAQFNDKRSVTFSPLGEAMTNPSPAASDGFEPRLAVGLRQAHGTTLMTNNDIAVVIDGSVGLPTIYRK